MDELHLCRLEVRFMEAVKSKNLEYLEDARLVTRLRTGLSRL